MVRNGMDAVCLPDAEPELASFAGSDENESEPGRTSTRPWAGSCTLGDGRNTSAETGAFVRIPGSHQLCPRPKRRTRGDTVVGNEPGDRDVRTRLRLASGEQNRLFFLSKQPFRESEIPAKDGAMISICQDRKLALRTGRGCNCNQPATNSPSVVPGSRFPPRQIDGTGSRNRSAYR